MVIRAAILFWAGILYLSLGGLLAVDANNLSVVKVEELIDKGQYAKAESIVGPVLKKNAHDSSALYLFGRIQYGQGNSELAGQYFQKAIKADNKNALAHWYLGLIYISNNQMYDAVDEWRIAVKYKPKLVKSNSCHCKSLDALFKQYPPRKGARRANST